MNTKLITIGVIVLLLLGLWYAMQAQNPADAPEEEGAPAEEMQEDTEEGTEASDEEAPEEGAVEIVYTSSGYVPESVTVASGTTVTFRNESSRLMWTASDPHPVHTMLSAFDALRGAAQGETYSYTFTESGEWGFHNHLSAQHGGSVIVE